jgi:hypothetical protein
VTPRPSLPLVPLGWLDALATYLAHETVSLALVGGVGDQLLEKLQEAVHSSKKGGPLLHGGVPLLHHPHIEIAGGGWGWLGVAGGGWGWLGVARGGWGWLGVAGGGCKLTW